MKMTGSDLRSFAFLAVLTLGGSSSGAKSPAGGDGAGGTSGAGGTAGHSSDAGAVDFHRNTRHGRQRRRWRWSNRWQRRCVWLSWRGRDSVDGGGAGGVGGGGHAGSTAGATGSGGGPATIQLGAIPGQDPALVTKAGPPITITGPAFTKPLFDGSVMVTDPAGNIILGYLADAVTTTVTKLAPDLSMLWTLTLANFRMGSSPLAVDASGNVYVGGEDQTQFAPTPAAIAQILANGTRGWFRTIGSSTGTNTVDSLAVGPQGQIVALGYSNGQLPQQPATVAGGGFMLAYASDGTLVKATQLKTISIVAQGLQVDTGGNSLFLNNLTIMKLDPSFATLWATVYDGSAASIMPTNVAALADGSGLYDYETSVGLVKRDPAAGAGVWSRAFATQTATLDSVEGETWKGQFTGTPIMLVTSDSIYLAGSYQNTYMNGSSPPPATSPGYVARLDLTGMQIWFRQFQRMPNPNAPTNIVPLQPTSLALSGPSKLVVYQGGFANNGGTLFLINAADGAGP